MMVNWELAAKRLVACFSTGVVNAIRLETSFKNIFFFVGLILQFKDSIMDLFQILSFAITLKELIKKNFCTPQCKYLKRQNVHHFLSNLAGYFSCAQGSMHGK